MIEVGRSRDSLEGFFLNKRKASYETTNDPKIMKIIHDRTKSSLNQAMCGAHHHNEDEPCTSREVHPRTTPQPINNTKPASLPAVS